LKEAKEIAASNSKKQKVKDETVDEGSDSEGDADQEEEQLVEEVSITICYSIHRQHLSVI